MNSKEKIPVIELASKQLDSLKFLLRLVWEIEIIKSSQYIVLSKQLADIGKQLGSWLRQLRKLSTEDGEKHA